MTLPSLSYAPHTASPLSSPSLSSPSPTFPSPASFQRRSSSPAFPRSQPLRPVASALCMSSMSGSPPSLTRRKSEEPRPINHMMKPNRGNGKVKMLVSSKKMVRRPFLPTCRPRSQERTALTPSWPPLDRAASNSTCPDGNSLDPSDSSRLSPPLLLPPTPCSPPSNAHPPGRTDFVHTPPPQPLVESPSCHALPLFSFT